MRKGLACLFLLLVGCGSSQPDTPAAPEKPVDDSVNNAYIICRVVDGTKLSAEPCKVDGWESSVDIRLDTNTRDAREICEGMAKQAAEKGMKFADRWKLQIFTPYSGDHPIASCSL